VWAEAQVALSCGCLLPLMTRSPLSSFWWRLQIPIYENPNFTAVQGTGTMMGIVHCICRIVGE